MANNRTPIRETGWIDYVLTAVLGALALYCCGQGIAQPVAGWILIGIYSTGTAFSFVVGTRLRQTRLAAFDGVIYAIAAGIAVFGQSLINVVLPSDTFPPELRSAGLLAWLLCLGSFAGWRDGTRLFQAVPALALFGLIGIYDTYPPAPFFFFGFLLCLALMFGRAHARSMLLQASRSGFSRVEEGVSLSESGAEQDSMLRAMRRGPWRWMAGPEWAVASAGAVILVSLFGAPIIKDSLQGVTGLVHFNLPQRIRERTQTTQAPSLTPESLQRLGLGPRRLTNTVVGWAELDRTRYLRSGIFEKYESGAWSEMSQQINTATPDVIAQQLQDIIHPRHYHFEVQMVDNNWALRMPVPAGVEVITDPGIAQVRMDGTVNAFGETMVEGTAYESMSPLNAGTPADSAIAAPATSRPDTTARVQALTQSPEVLKSRTDFDKAMAIMDIITSRAKYNLKAAAVTPGQDPIDDFLFNSHEGYCDLFASAMVVLARNAGMDAHYVIGYLTRREDRDANGRYILRQSDSHSWAEIYFKGHGWVVFDPTGQAEDVTPKDQDDIVRLAALWAPLTGVFAILIGVVYYAPRFHFTLRLPEATKRQNKLDRLYGRFAIQLGKRAGSRKPSAMTPDAWLEATRPKLGATAALAEQLNARFVRALYSKDAVSEAEISEIKSELRSFKRARR